jgi:hypothetical protein
LANGDVDVTEGSGLKVGTYTISEDAVTRHLQRVAVNDSAGADILGTTADAASATTTIKAALRAIATALGTSALDLGVGTGGSRTLRMAIDTASQNANGQATMANSAPVVIASDDPVAVSLALIDDAIKADDAAFTPATTKVMMAGFQADEASTDSVDEGDAGAARMTLDRKVIVTTQPHTAGGLSVFRSLDLDETEEEVKATAGCLYKIRATNRTTSVRYLKLYNATAANTTVGTTTPIDTIPIPANASDYTVLTESFGGLGLTFDTALSMAVTTGFADNDTGAPGANDVIVSAYYK